LDYIRRLATKYAANAMLATRLSSRIGYSFIYPGVDGGGTG
jgi:hypothetical protein